ncbi:MAG TPA: hypothetical protein VN753_13795 [Terracidiphilus sp.]|nr:hypothetical protein [Terracidiphilus sp.]
MAQFLYELGPDDHDTPFLSAALSFEQNATHYAAALVGHTENGQL